MGIYDLELLKQICEKLKDGKLQLNLSYALSDPTAVYNTILGVVILGMYVGMGIYFCKGLKKICDEDERVRGEQLYSNPPEFVVTSIESSKDEDPTDKMKAHKILGNGYLD